MKALHSVGHGINGRISMNTPNGKYFTQSTSTQNFWIILRNTSFFGKQTSESFEDFHFQEFLDTEVPFDNDENPLKAFWPKHYVEQFSTAFNSFIEEQGIHHQLTVAHNPKQNGTSAQMNRTMLNLVRPMLHHKSIPNHFWAEALFTALYVFYRAVYSS